MVTLVISARTEEIQPVWTPAGDVQRTGEHTTLVLPSAPCIQVSYLHFKQDEGNSQALPSHHLWYAAKSVPVPTRSSRFGPQAVTLGRVVRIPPSDSQPPQAEPARSVSLMGLNRSGRTYHPTKDAVDHWQYQA